jgi:hypothetical protein
MASPVTKDNASDVIDSGIRRRRPLVSPAKFVVSSGQHGLQLLKADVLPADLSYCMQSPLKDKPNVQQPDVVGNHDQHTNHRQLATESVDGKWYKHK